MLRKTNTLAFLVVLVLASAYASMRGFWALYDEYRSASGEVRVLEQQVDDLKQQERELSDKVERLKGGADPVEMEAAIRRNRHLVREGERIYRVELPPEVEAEREEDPGERPVVSGLRDLLN